jgi:DNA-binding MarR family transcriptional regulator
VSLTRHGSAVASSIQAAAVDERSRVFAGFDDRELDTLATALDRIDENVRALLSE